MLYDMVKRNKVLLILCSIFIPILIFCFWPRIESSDMEFILPLIIILIPLYILQVLLRYYISFKVMRPIWKQVKRENPFLFWGSFFLLFIPMIAVVTTVLIIAQMGISDKIDKPELFHWGVLVAIVFIFLLGLCNLIKKSEKFF